MFPVRADPRQELTDSLERHGEPRLRTLLCMGGVDMKDQVCGRQSCLVPRPRRRDVLQSSVLSRGVHIVVSTPGKLIDMLEKQRINLDVCRCAAVAPWTSHAAAATSASTRPTA